MSGIAALGLPALAERHLYEPGAVIAQLADWEERLDATAARVMRQDITLLAGLPTWTMQLARAVRLKAAGPKRSITNSSKPCGQTSSATCTAAFPSGPSTVSYGEFGPDVVFHEVYAATEALLAAQDDEAGAGLRVTTGSTVVIPLIAGLLVSTSVIASRTRRTSAPGSETKG